MMCNSLHIICASWIVHWNNRIWLGSTRTKQHTDMYMFMHSCYSFLNVYVLNRGWHLIWFVLQFRRSRTGWKREWKRPQDLPEVLPMQYAFPQIAKLNMGSRQLTNQRPPAKFPKSYLSSDDPQAKAPKRKIVEGSERIAFNPSSQKGKVACEQPQKNKSQRTFPSDSPDTKVSKR